MNTPPDPYPIRKSSLPPTPSPEWEFSSVLGARPDGLPGIMLLPGDTGSVVVRRRVSYGDWEPVRPAYWADEPLPVVQGDGGAVSAGVREVRIVVQAPTDENAGQWAETIRDLVVSEYGESMRLDVTICPEVRR